MQEVGLCDVVHLDQDFEYGIKPYLLRDFARVTSGDQVVDQFPNNDVEVLVSIVARHGFFPLLAYQARALLPLILPTHKLGMAQTCTSMRVSKRYDIKQ